MKVDFGVPTYSASIEGLWNIIKDALNVIKYYDHSEISEIKHKFDKELSTCKSDGRDPSNRFTVKFSPVNILQYESVGKIKPLELSAVSVMFSKAYGAYSDLLFKIKQKTVDTSSDEFEKIYSDIQEHVLEGFDTYKSRIVDGFSDLKESVVNGVIDASKLADAGYTCDSHDRFVFNRCDEISVHMEQDVRDVSNLDSMIRDFDIGDKDNDIPETDKNVVSRMHRFLQTIKRDYELSLNAILTLQSALVRIMNKDYECLCKV